MTDKQLQAQKTVLSDDGELRDVAQVQPRPTSIYCIHCGSSNRAEAQFCRSCGQSLEDQETESVRPGYRNDGEKLKRQASEAIQVARSSRQMNVPMMIYSLAKLVIVAGLVITLYNNSTNVSLPIIVLIAWVIVEGLQSIK